MKCLLFIEQKIESIQKSLSQSMLTLAGDDENKLKVMLSTVNVLTRETYKQGLRMGSLNVIEI